ncbi:hypothetical protein ACFQ3S_08960 [Mucilaginibacter terrae]|uniref:hypothetical protein n=1 Tax=Mucilaginibacter terrae TaxID=1955052 RepID=UPI00364191F1
MRKKLFTYLLLIAYYTTSAQIERASVFNCSWLDLSTAGTKDWVVYGQGTQSKPVSNYASDFKKNGAGINKSFIIIGTADLKNDLLKEFGVITYCCR